ncbi:unnamed protein product [Effrenium voratum]|uniref:Uncharacterized protein n=1 Tax=Effrenium voratum TaxID=2562239 RepID=A0AA36NBB3_9DINO|nr:unnamed protein product [Effrenium voratum]
MGNTCCDGKHQVAGETFRKSQVDLVRAAVYMIDFLNEVDRYPCLYANHAVLQRAIHRYHNIWLPLLAGVDGPDLVPPLDVEWVWHLHMLCPQKYLAHVQRAPVHRLKARSGPAWEAAKARGQGAWKLQTQEPFDVLPILAKELTVAEGSTTWSSPISYDLIAAAERQMSFRYQVAIMPHYRDKYFLELAVERYLDRFLELKRRHPKEFWVPTYDIDCIWHAHQLHPDVYLSETKELCGSLLPHDDSVNDRSEGSKLQESWERTQQVWNEEFGSKVATAGGMFRGNVTLEERLWQAKQWELLTQGPRETQRFWIALRAEYCRQNDTTQWIHKKDELERLQASFQRWSASTDGTFAGRVWHGRDIHGKACSNVEVVHSADPTYLPLVTAHLIAKDQLPSPQQVSNADDYPTISAGERAYLVRVASEDVAVLTGTWQGFRKGKHGDPGKLKVKLFALKPQRFCQVERVTESASSPSVFNFNLSPLGAGSAEGRVIINLATGLIHGDSREASGIAYGFGLALAALHVALQPRKKVETLGSGQTRYGDTAVAQHKFPFLISAGGADTTGQSTDWILHFADAIQKPALAQMPVRRPPVFFMPVSAGVCQARISWAQFKASKLPAAKAELERRWELLVADEEARDLLAMRQRLTHSTDPGLVQLRGEVDKMIGERAEVLEKGVLVGTGTEAGSQEDVPVKGSKRPSVLVRRLGLDTASLPSPFLVFLKLFLHGKDNTDEQVLATLKEWQVLSPLQRRALWSIVLHSAREQDRQIDSALGIAGAAKGGRNGGGFSQFWEEHQASGACGVSEVDVQRAFLHLPEEELSSVLLPEVLPWRSEW